MSLSDAEALRQGQDPTFLASCHLLRVADSVRPQQVWHLVRDHYPAVDLHARSAVLGRQMTLSGPWPLSPDLAGQIRVPAQWSRCFALQSQREREAPPIPGVGDRDGISAAFPDGMPWRDEGRGIGLLVAMARRLGGSVRISGAGILTPDPLRAVNYTVYAPMWLKPEELIALGRPIIPGLGLELPEPRTWSGSAPTQDSASAGIDAQSWERLCAELDEMDRLVTSEVPVLDGYALSCQIGAEDTIEIGVREGSPDEPALAHTPLRHQRFVSFDISWHPHDPADRELFPAPNHVRHRRTALQQITKALAVLICETTSGIVTDEDGFGVDRYELTR